MNRSPIHDSHTALGARFVDFGGWEMPVDYGSVLAEHRAVRSSAGFFDVSHLGRFRLRGKGARGAIGRLLSNDLDRIGPGRTQYTLMLNPAGGILDDLIVWWWDDVFWILPNAANHETVMERFASEPECEVEDLRRHTVMIALQGPAAPSVFERVLGEAPRRFRTAQARFEGGVVHMAGTGYTGEAGGEICTEPDTGRALVNVLGELKITPCGLGARDTLRLEAGLPLWGQDMDETVTPFEAGLGFAVAMDREFVGRSSLAIQDDEGVGRRLAGFKLTERGIPRHGYAVRAGNSRGVVTSGNLSPQLDAGIGFALMQPPVAVGEALEVEIRGRWVPGVAAKTPFHQGRP